MGQMMFKSPVEQEIENTTFASSGNASDHIFTMNNWRDFPWALLSSGIESKF